MTLESNGIGSWPNGLAVARTLNARLERRAEVTDATIFLQMRQHLHPLKQLAGPRPYLTTIRQV